MASKDEQIEINIINKELNTLSSNKNDIARGIGIDAKVTFKAVRITLFK